VVPVQTEPQKEDDVEQVLLKKPEPKANTEKLKALWKQYQMGYEAEQKGDMH